MKVTSTITVEQTGIGKADYSREVALGKVRPGLTLKYGESLNLLTLSLSTIASPFVTVVKPPLAPGDKLDLIDASTGLSLYTVPKGYTYEIFQIGYEFNQDSRILSYFDTIFLGQLWGSVGGMAYAVAAVAGWSTVLLDPTAGAPHAIVWTLENLGGGNMEGSCSVWAIVRAVGTSPLPNTKTVKCKHCGNKWDVPRETTRIECPACGGVNLYLDLSKVRSLQ